MYLFFDTETTGLSRNSDHVVQLAWILANQHGDVVKEESHIIRPTGYSIPPSAAQIHGISTANALEVGKPLKWVLERLTEAAELVTVATAHNLSFDLGILQTDYKKAGLPFPFHRMTQVCTMKLSTTWCRLQKLNGSPGFKYPKLEELHYRLFGHSFDNAHDALSDTRACKRCYFELVKIGIISEIADNPLLSKHTWPLVDKEFSITDESSDTDKNILPSQHASLERKLAKRNQRIFKLTNQIKVLKAELADVKRAGSSYTKSPEPPRLVQVNALPIQSVKSNYTKPDSRSYEVRPPKDKKSENKVKLPNWLTDKKRILLEENGYRFLLDKGQVVAVSNGEQRTRLFGSLDLDHLIEMVHSRQIGRLDSCLNTTSRNDRSNPENTETAKPWVLDKNNQCIRNRITGAAYSISSLIFVAGPTPGYEDISRRLWIRKWDIEDGE